MTGNDSANALVPSSANMLIIGLVVLEYNASTTGNLAESFHARCLAIRRPTSMSNSIDAAGSTQARG